MREEEIKLVIGSLLHDIGKVVYRTGEAKERHSRLGADYLLNRIGLKDKDVLDCVRFHHGRELSQAHLPENNLAYIVYMADNMIKSPKVPSSRYFW
jgi:CRISPR-associated protein Csm1